MMRMQIAHHLVKESMQRVMVTLVQQESLFTTCVHLNSRTLYPGQRSASANQTEPGRDALLSVLVSICSAHWVLNRLIFITLVIIGCYLGHLRQS